MADKERDPAEIKSIVERNRATRGNPQYRDDNEKAGGNRRPLNVITPTKKKKGNFLGMGEGEAAELVAISKTTNQAEAKNDPELAGLTTGEEKLKHATHKSNMMGLKNFMATGSAADLRRYGVSTDIMQRIIIDDERQLNACMSLPSTLIFFILFMLFFQQHYQTSFIYLQTGVLRSSFADASYEVNDISGMYEWIRETFIPFVYSTDRNLGATEPGQIDGAGAIMETVGGILFRTQRSKLEPCKDDIVKDHLLCNPMLNIEDNGQPYMYDEDAGYLNGWTKAKPDDPRGGSYTRRLYNTTHTHKNWRYTETSRSSFASDWIEAFGSKLGEWFPHRNLIRSGKHDYATDGSLMEKLKELPEGELDSVMEKLYEEDMKAEKELSNSLDEKARKERPRRIWKMKKETWAKKAKDAKKKKGKKSLKYWQKPTKGWKPFGPLRSMLNPLGHANDKELAGVRAKRDELNSRRLKQVRPRLITGGWIPWPYIGYPGCFEYVMPMSISQNDALKVINAWEENKIVDRSTTFFGVEVMLRNPSIGEGVLTHAFVQFVFSRGGFIYSEVKLPTLVLEDQKLVFLWAALWIGMLIFQTIMIPGRTCGAWRRGKLRIHLKRVWNLLEWVLMIAGWIIIGVFMIERFSVFKFKKHFKKYQQDYKTNLFAGKTETDLVWFDKIHRNIYSAGSIDSFVQTFVAWYHLALILRFFVASRGQVRLAIVVNTLIEASIDLLHLVIVFGIIFIAYVISGFILFGRRMDSLSTIPDALAYTIQIVLMKEFDFDGLTYQDFWTVAFWTFTFVLLVVLVLVNIVLAMVFDTYGEVRGQVTAGDGVDQTVWRIFNQFRNAGAWVSNTDLLLAIKKISMDESSDGHITLKALKQAVPHITPPQMMHLFGQSKIKLEASMSHNKNALPEAIASVLQGISQLKEGVAVMRTGVHPKRAKSRTTKTAAGGSTEVEDTVVDDDESTWIAGPDGCPNWVKQGLMPFLSKQGRFIDQVQNEMDSLAAHLSVYRGVGKDVGKMKYCKPTNPWEEGATIYPWGEHEGPMKEERSVLVAPEPPASCVPAVMGKAQTSGETVHLLSSEK